MKSLWPGPSILDVALFMPTLWWRPVIGLAGGCMSACGDDGAYGYEDDDEESAKSDSK
jgi:hypothetical protein